MTKSEERNWNYLAITDTEAEAEEVDASAQEAGN